MACALFWLPVLFIVMASSFPAPGRYSRPPLTGGSGITCWACFTPLALASVHARPKVMGRPIQSHNLSLLGFWGLAFFLWSRGGHHLIGGPVPQWLTTLSIVQSMMMIIPVIAFTINQYQTLEGNLSVMRFSPTLRFGGVGGLMYTASSIQRLVRGPAQHQYSHAFHPITRWAMRTWAYQVRESGFFAMYFVLPRITSREWPIEAHRGALLALDHRWYCHLFLSLSIGGWLQGLAMLDAGQPFMASVAVTLPYLQGRSVGGSLMVLSHLVFAWHFVCLVLNLGPHRQEAARFSAVIGRRRLHDEKRDQIRFLAPW